ncbi:hypothetical protein [Catenovulum maritimum]|uniref:Solute-binding protein family 3/N-terminal domain-containing protein n=1 Tax=Catenovulum maritimum TaxID=1513271 RepID=A0A0J8GVA2_9ALTE|nr:hypothetical protein [Catenovulum maritimum]KMT66667.1 hypothetical protein XM47_00600 [Catenovulum maritimum]
MAPLTNFDQRNVYERELLKLALKLTATKDTEEFVLASNNNSLLSHGSNLSLKRIETLAKQGFYKNFFFKFSVRDNLLEDFLAIPFPLERGIVGYRVSFVSKQNQSLLTPLTRIEHISKLTTLQGIGWLDSDILTKNGMPVFTISVYEKMFEMINENRAELFFRGINEWHSEYQTFKYQFPNLSVDQNIALHYKMPRFFFTAKHNVKNAKRVEAGLKMAFENGQLQKLWNQFYAESVKASKLSKRTIIPLDNPYIKNLNKGYEKYNISLQELIEIELSTEKSQ